MSPFDDDGFETSSLEESRREAEFRMAELRRALRLELGTAPRKAGWWLLVAAGAVGVALGLGWGLSRRRRLSGRGDRGEPGGGAQDD